MERGEVDGPGIRSFYQPAKINPPWILLVNSAGLEEFKTRRDNGQNMDWMKKMKRMKSGMIMEISIVMLLWWDKRWNVCKLSAFICVCDDVNVILVWGSFLFLFYFYVSDIYEIWEDCVINLYFNDNS